MTTGSTTSADDRRNWAGRRISHEDFACDLEKRREALGIVDMPRNAGTRRTPSKRALLEAIASTGAKW